MIRVRDAGQQLAYRQVFAGHRGDEVFEGRAVRLGHRREWIEGRENERLVTFVEVDADDGYRRLTTADRHGYAEVPIDQATAAAIDDDVLHPADAVERFALQTRMRAPVALVRNERFGCFFAVTDDAILPVIRHQLPSSGEHGSGREIELGRRDWL